jgi:photosystem II stability/assembly factor-like uncharacterized protein/uncharacterized protein YraI
VFKRFLGVILLAGMLVTQSVPQAQAQTYCDHAQFVSDITVPDGSTFSPGEAFTKTWRLKNIGTCTWTTSYSLVWTGGDPLGSPRSVNIPATVAPGQTVDISVSLTAPASSGHYKGLWKLFNAQNIEFGIGNTANAAFWADINVVQNSFIQSSSSPITWVAFDFLEYALSSSWRSGAGSLTFPGVTGDSRGFANFVNEPHLEDGTFETSKGLLMAPQNKTDGYIQMTSPNILVSQGDKLETLVSCEFNATNCYVTFRIDYLREDGGQIRLWSWKEAFDGRSYRASIDLSPLAGKAVRFVFMTLATGSASGDRALWVAPRIIRTTGGQTPVPPTPTPGTHPTQTPPSGGGISSPNIQQIYMKDALNGWAFTDTYVLKTSNGGASWTNVSPPTASFLNGATGFFSSSSAGWVLTGENYLYRTTNGGLKWTTYSVPFNNGFLQFTDSYHGFVLSILGVAMQKQAVALYKTNDGGATWTKTYDNSPTLPTPGTSLPFGGHKNGMTFRDSLSGWVGGDYPTNGYVYLYRTTDAGKNWSQQALTLPAGYESAFLTITAPAFFGASNALLPVWMGRTEGRDLFTYTTTNGGISWNRSTGYARGVDFVDFISAKNGFAWSRSGAFQVTSNAGATWTQVTPNINFGDDFRAMDFVSTTTGWVIQKHTDGYTSLYKTTDGAVTWTLLSTNRPGGSPTNTPAPAVCDKATFVTDVTILDGTLFAPNTPFTKIWRLKNSGSCAWTTSYKLIFQSGDQMSAPASIALPVNVAPGETVDLSAPMTAPGTAGKYRGYWMLSNAAGSLFGIGDNGSSPFWVEINVSGGGATTDTAYDFTANVCAAQWKSGAGALPCPGVDGSSSGFVVKLDTPVMEDGSTSAPGLLTSPQNKYDGYIQGFYPEFTVQAGDRFQAKVGCQSGQNCYVTYRLNYMTTSGWIGTFWQWRESNDGKYYTADVDLTPLAGKKVRFILTILATGSAIGDRAVWSAPRIYRAGAGTPPTATPPTPPTTAPVTPSQSLPDLTISSMRIELMNTTCLNPGDSLGTRVWVVNNGGTGAGSFLVTVNNASQSVSGLAAGETKALFFPGFTNPVSAIVDSGSAVTESNETNNARNEMVAVPTAPLPCASATPTTSGVTSLNAKVTAGLLSCRYGPGVEYLYLYALNQGANIKLIGRTDANNWVWVDGTNKCWVNSNYLQITGDRTTLPIVYPGTAKLPVSPYYPAPAWASAVRNGNSVTVEWAPVPVSAGDYEDAEMHQYILEVWRCEAGKIIFETLGSNTPSITVARDEAGCSTPSRGRVFVQEKHGFAGPVEPPWTQPGSASATSTPTPPDFTTFGNNIVTVLNGRSFDLAKGMMYQTFGFAFWGSEGYAATPDQAIETLRINYIGSTPLAANPYKDLTALLNGMNPYSIMNLDPAKSQALFVSGWGLDGKGEAILYMTRKSDNSIYWHSVLIAPTGFQQVTLKGPYAVVNVAASDSLNVRAGAGVNQPIIGYLSPDATDVMRTGPSTSVDGAVWVEVRRNDGLTGWVNSFHLTEYVTHDAFCADTRVLTLIEKLKQSMGQSDGSVLAPIVSPSHGVNMHLWAYGPGINFPQNKTAAIYTDTTVYNWGGGPSGIPDSGTFNAVVKPKYLDALNASNRETYCDNLTKVFPLSRPWPYDNIRYYNLYKPATPDVFFDFRTLLVGIEYIDGQPYLYGMVTIIWEP